MLSRREFLGGIAFAASQSAASRLRVGVIGCGGRGVDTELHLRNLLRVIRFNEPLKCDETLGYRGVVACQFGILSQRQRKYMKWDAAAQRIMPA